jgi:hypothetical protein
MRAADKTSTPAAGRRGIGGDDMPADDFTLVAGTYDDAGAALSDAESLKNGQDAGCMF